MKYFSFSCFSFCLRLKKIGYFIFPFWHFGFFVPIIDSSSSSSKQQPAAAAVGHPIFLLRGGRGWGASESTCGPRASAQGSGARSLKLPQVRGYMRMGGKQENTDPRRQGCCDRQHIIAMRHTRLASVATSKLLSVGALLALRLTLLLLLVSGGVWLINTSSRDEGFGREPPPFLCLLDWSYATTTLYFLVSKYLGARGRREIETTTAARLPVSSSFCHVRVRAALRGTVACGHISPVRQDTYHNPGWDRPNVQLGQLEAQTPSTTYIFQCCTVSRC